MIVLCRGQECRKDRFGERTMEKMSETMRDTQRDRENERSFSSICSPHWLIVDSVWALCWSIKSSAHSEDQRYLWWKHRYSACHTHPNTSTPRTHTSETCYHVSWRNVISYFNMQNWAIIWTSCSLWQLCTNDCFQQQTFSDLIF